MYSLRIGSLTYLWEDLAACLCCEEPSKCCSDSVFLDKRDVSPGLAPIGAEAAVCAVCVAGNVHTTACATCTQYAEWGGSLQGVDGKRSLVGRLEGGRAGGEVGGGGGEGVLRGRLIAEAPRSKPPNILLGNTCSGSRQN